MEIDADFVELNLLFGLRTRAQNSLWSAPGKRIDCRRCNPLQAKINGLSTWHDGQPQRLLNQRGFPPSKCARRYRSLSGA